MLTAEAIKQQARELGFDLCGIAAADHFQELELFSEWLDRGFAGDMSYLSRSADARASIRGFLPSARSVIVVAAAYAAANESLSSGAALARIARYARGEDYHDVLATRLEALVAWLRATQDAPFDAAIFADKGPVQERAYAQRAGLGWIGKNTCLIDPTLGSWLLLGGIATSLELDADAQVEDLCGSCTLCLDACPTGALVDERQLDATKCISYLTIETRASIPEPLRAFIGDHAWGCDVCQDVCPYNLAPLDATLQPLAARPDRIAPSAADLWQRSDRELRDFVDGSAMTYRSLARLRRNLAVVIGNSRDEHAAAALDRAGHGLRHAAQSADTPLVREHVAWAKARLAAPVELSTRMHDAPPGC